jgi:hypothetical protein
LKLVASESFLASCLLPGHQIVVEEFEVKSNTVNTAAPYG